MSSAEILSYLGGTMEKLPDDMDIVRRHARYLEREAARITEEALIAGALPGDFKVVHIYRRPGPMGTTLA